MRNYLLTGLITIALGIGLGVYIGWVQYPVEYRNSYMCQLSDGYQEEYTLMVARGYREDGDLNKALDRLQPLRAVGVPECDDGRSYHYTYLNFDGNVRDPKNLSVGLNFLNKK